MTDSPIPDRWQIGNYTFQRCPGSIITRQSVEYLRAYQWRDKAFLPNPGGWMEQPAKLIEAFAVIDQEVHRQRMEEVEHVKRSGGHRGTHE